MTVIDLFKLTDQVALVTGGAKGIGTVISEGLLEAGVKSLIFCGRGRHGLIETEEKRLQNLFPQATVIGITCDVTDENEVASMIETIKDQEKSVSILVNNAGVTWAAPTIDQTVKSWHRVIDTNLTGTFIVTRDIIRDLMLSDNQGSIINISSLLALLGVEAMIAQVGYSASKAALLGLTQQLAVEFAGRGIRINAILPGFVEGDTMAKIFTNPKSPVRESLLDLIPLRRFVSGNDLKAAVCFLASEASSFITGQAIILDGGFSVK